ncbi:DNA excision repair protein ERCC-5 -like protein [Halotydeus destructor]|nr:DNA excision repair protein ERCC-5 -like protein [Halotydeus destructor]
MGVTGLWKLVEPVGQPVKLETLEGKILAVDASIWINQAIKGFRDNEGQSLPNAHLLGLYHRLCKLLYFKIKPVFVFDGTAPYLKQHTLEERRKRRFKAVAESKKTVNKVLVSYLNSKVNEPLEIPANAFEPAHLLSSFLPRANEETDEMYTLPETSEILERVDEHEDSRRRKVIRSKIREFQNLDDVDVLSADFLSLPVEVRHEILTSLKERRDGFKRILSLPKESTDFSSFQMSRLLHKQELQKHIDNTIVELNSKETDGKVGLSGQIASETGTHFVLFSGKEDSKRTRKGFRRRKADWDEHKVKKPMLGNIFGDTESFDYGKYEATKSDGAFLLSQIASDTDLVSSQSTQISNQSNEPDCIVIDDNALIDEDVCEVGIMSDDGSSDSNEQTSNTGTTKQPLSHEISIEPEQLLPENDQDSNILETTINLSDEDETVDEAIFTEVSRERSNVVSLKLQDLQNPEKIDFESEDFLTLPEEIQIELLQDRMPPPSTGSAVHEERVRIPTSALPEKSQSISQRTSPMQMSPVSEPSTSSKIETRHKTPQDTEIAVPVQSTPSPSAPSNPNLASSSRKAVLEKAVNKSPVKMLSREEMIELSKKANAHERHSNTVTEKMEFECKEMLALFGIPYVVSPTEAEAQCAALETLGLTNGTITDDSDIWLFGAEMVYKNFFTQSKYIEVFRAKEIETHFKLNRDSLICMALLTGSDYTTGIDGVGPVSAVEILSEFQGKGLEPLENFKAWWLSKRNGTDKTPGNKVRSKLLKLQLEDGFPNRVIFDAYIRPVVDESPEKFSWSLPDLDLIRDYCKAKLGWSQLKVDEGLLPVMKRLNESKTQTRIDSFFQPAVSKGTSVASKRLAQALGRLEGADLSPTGKGTDRGSGLKLKEKVRRQRIKGARKKDVNHSAVAKEKMVKKKKKSKSATKEATITPSEESSNLNPSQEEPGLSSNSDDEACRKIAI